MSDNANATWPVHNQQTVYPKPDYAFRNARIGLTYADSTPDFPPPDQAPPGAPNILLVLLDDVGFGWLSTFGGHDREPHAGAVGAERAALRRVPHHRALLADARRAADRAQPPQRRHRRHPGDGHRLSRLQRAHPAQHRHHRRDAAPERLRHRPGSARTTTSPTTRPRPAGPFDRWPTALGFDYFYGFIGGETDQFYPALYRGTTPVEADKTPEEGYQLTRDLADDCIAWMREQKAIAPDRPFFAYFAPGAAHAPHQPPLDWRGRHAGKFDMGWDEYQRQDLRAPARARA